MQKKWKDRKLIVIDEFSMLRQRELYFINERLKQILCSDALFGGIVVVLIGDPGQLPPVKGKCLWDNKPKNQSPDWFGYMLYKEFHTAIKLIKSNRLDRSDPDALKYERFLDCLQDGKNTQNDWEYFRKLGSKESLNVSQWTSRGFNEQDTVHLYTKNREVAKRNLKCLENLRLPIVKIEANYTGGGRHAKTSEAGGLVQTLYLCEGSLVIPLQM